MEDWRAMFHTIEDLDRAWEEARTKTKWGRWTLDTEGAYPSLDICPYPGRNNAKYEVRLFSLKPGCSFGDYLAWLGHWVQHLQDKSWISPTELWDFVDASQDIYRTRTDSRDGEAR